MVGKLKEGILTGSNFLVNIFRKWVFSWCLQVLFLLIIGTFFIDQSQLKFYFHYRTILDGQH